jgi:hypothetical protein
VDELVEPEEDDVVEVPAEYEVDVAAKVVCGMGARGVFADWIGCGADMVLRVA